MKKFFGVVWTWILIFWIIIEFGFMWIFNSFKIKKDEE